MTADFDLPRIVSREEWLDARKALLQKEKELLRHHDAVSAERRRLPMVRIDKAYVFEGARGTARLIDLFEGRRQLIVYHFMFEPDAEQGCPACSFQIDDLCDLTHVHARRTTFVLISRAPFARIKPFHQRMGWNVPWYSSILRAARIPGSASSCATKSRSSTPTRPIRAAVTFWAAPTATST